MFEEEKEVLVGKDPALKKVMEPDLELKPDRNHFRALCKSVVWQQLAGKAAEKIWENLSEEVDVTPEGVLEAGFETLRKAGLSGRKAEYILGIAKEFLDNFDRNFDDMENEEVIRELTKLRGVGEWTAEMFLIFSLGRMDVFAADDYGLQKAVQRLYSLEELPKKKEVRDIASKWKPYRTVASLALWKWID